MSVVMMWLRCVKLSVCGCGDDWDVLSFSVVLRVGGRAQLAQRGGTAGAALRRSRHSGAAQPAQKGGTAGTAGRHRRHSGAAQAAQAAQRQGGRMEGV